MEMQNISVVECWRSEIGVQHVLYIEYCRITIGMQNVSDRSITQNDNHHFVNFSGTAGIWYFAIASIILIWYSVQF